MSIVILGELIHRVRGKNAVILEMMFFLSWIPLLWVSLTTQHHALMPFSILFLIISIFGLITATTLNSWSSGPFLAIFTLVGLVMIIDMLMPESKPQVILDKRPEIFAIHDSLCGYRPMPDEEVKITCWKGGNIVYHIRYHFDTCSRRKVPGGDPLAAVDNPHAIFMGGSCTFGENINDSETLPAQFAVINPEYSVYNYAFIGYGPQQMLSLLNSGELQSDIPSTRGILLYGAIPDHIRRAAGSYTTLAWGSDFPRYVQSGDELKLTGSFVETRRRLTTFYDYLRRSPSLDYLAKYIDSILWYRPSQWKRFLDILEESRRVYRERFDGELMVFFWPFTLQSYESLADSVQSRGIPVLDLDIGSVLLDDESLFVPYDVHPSGRYNKYMAEALSLTLTDRNGVSRSQ